MEGFILGWFVLRAMHNFARKAEKAAQKKKEASFFASSRKVRLAKLPANMSATLQATLKVTGLDDRPKKDRGIRAWAVSGAQQKR